MPWFVSVVLRDISKVVRRSTKVIPKAVEVNQQLRLETKMVLKLIEKRRKRRDIRGYAFIYDGHMKCTI